MSAIRTGQGSWLATGAVVAAILAIMIAVGSRSSASAQSYPVKPIHIVVPFAAGGITDMIGRALGQLDGQVFVFFVIVVAAAEAAVGLGIVIVVARSRQSLNVERVNLLKL